MKRSILLLLMLSSCGNSVIERAKDAVTQRTRDPENVQFRNVRQCTGAEEMVVGEVNAKNAFGGYVGYTPFFWDRGVVTILDSSVDNSEGRKFVNELARRCREAPA